MSDQFDVVVIGSGFGGSILACRLAQAGKSVCVLERGKRWTATTVPRSPTQVARDGFWDADRGQFGLLEYRAFKRMHVIQGCGVGGGSLHYFNVHIRPPASIFDDPRWPADMTLDSLSPYYDLARDMMDAKPLSPPPGREMPERTAHFQDACRRTGRESELVPIAVHTGPPRLNPAGGVPQLPCDYNGNCGLGCTAGAKNSMDVTYLPLAERHGAEVRPLHTAELIVPLDGGGYRVDFTVRDEADPTEIDVGSVEGTEVVIAAGTLGTNELLLRCNQKNGTLPKLSKTLGHGFSGNGDLLLVGTMTERKIDPGWGPSITAGVDVGEPGAEAYIEDLGYPDQILWFIEGMIAAASLTVNPLRAFRILELFTFNQVALKSATDRISKEREALFDGGRTTGFLPYLGMCKDAADGKFSIDRSGALDLDWNPRASASAFAQLETALKELSGALDGHYVSSPLYDWPWRNLLTAHPLGGCAMSEDATTGVVDEYGRVHGYDGLYVADGSIVPTALARNPSATIAALSERIAFHMLNKRDLRKRGDRKRPAVGWPSPLDDLAAQIKVPA